MFHLFKVKVMPRLRLLISIFLLSLVSACSGTYHAYKTMYDVALSASEDIVLDHGTITSARHDYLYVRRGDRPQVALALRYIEQNQLKWMSADNSMLVTSAGRIIRTIGLENDLLHITNKTADPLQKPLAITSSSTWLRLADWSLAEYGYQIRSQFHIESGHSLAFFGHELPVIKVTETLRYENDANFVRFDGNWQNVFWLDAKTGEMLKTQQRLQPGTEEIELTFITEAARQLAAAGITVDKEAI